MNLSEILRKIPEEKLYKNPNIKENLTNKKNEILEELSDMLEQKRKEAFMSNKNKPS
jgi:transcription initiation factor IIE alpha subunit